MSPTKDLEALFLDELERIERVIAFVCRRNCCYGDEADDFHGEAMLKLIEDDYRRLASFKGNSSLSTYLNTVVQRLFQDYRIKKWGKWRPSAAATREGDSAKKLEMLISRDGRSEDEAIETLLTNDKVPESREELRKIVEKLPHRVSRTIEQGEVLDRMPGGESPEHRVVDSERRRSFGAVQKAVEKVIGLMDPEDAYLLRLRNFDGVSVIEVAKMMGTESRKMYTRFDRIYRQLRRGLEERGVSAEQVRELMGWEESDLVFDFDSVTDSSIGELGRAADADSTGNDPRASV